VETGNPTYSTRLVNPPNRDAALLVTLNNLGTNFLFDCGSLEPLSNQAKQRVRRVFITHGHIDHTIGLDQLVRSLIYSREPLDLYGPPGILEQVGHRLQGYAWNLTGDSPFVVRAHQLGLAEVHTCIYACSRQFQPLGPITSAPAAGELWLPEGPLVSWLPVDHGVPCLAYALTWPGQLRFLTERAQLDGRPPGPWVGELKAHPERQPDLAERYLERQPFQKLAYVTDTLLGDIQREALLPLVQFSTELWCESNYLHKDLELASQNLHATVVQAATLARDAQVGALHLFHISRRYPGDLSEHVNEARAVFDDSSLGCRDT
jgi:ribonuclease Z